MKSKRDYLSTCLHSTGTVARKFEVGSSAAFSKMGHVRAHASQVPVGSPRDDLEDNTLRCTCLLLHYTSEHPDFLTNKSQTTVLLLTLTWASASSHRTCTAPDQITPDAGRRRLEERSARLGQPLFARHDGATKVFANFDGRSVDSGNAQTSAWIAPFEPVLRSFVKSACVEGAFGMNAECPLFSKDTF